MAASPQAIPLLTWQVELVAQVETAQPAGPVVLVDMAVMVGRAAMVRTVRPVWMRMVATAVMAGMAALVRQAAWAGLVALVPSVAQAVQRRSS